MSSTLQALTSLQQNNYVTLFVITAVWYDYVLTFSKEVEYIWLKPWTWVSTLFILARYLGLCAFMYSALIGSSFLPGPMKLYASLLFLLAELQNNLYLFNRCTIIYGISGCTFLLFLGATDFLMILRAWAMYNQSRLIIVALLTLLLLELVFTTVNLAINTRKSDIVTIVQILDYSLCVTQTAPSVWAKWAIIFQMIHGTVLCAFAVFQFMRQSLQMYRTTKRRQLNQYMDLLVKQGILYFLVFFVYNLANILFYTGMVTDGEWQSLLLTTVQLILPYTLVPRFVISIRELYACDVRRGYGGGIDTGFGLSLSGQGAGEAVIMFADVGNEGLEDTETRMRVGGTESV